MIIHFLDEAKVGMFFIQCYIGKPGPNVALLKIPHHHNDIRSTAVQFKGNMFVSSAEATFRSLALPR